MHFSEAGGRRKNNEVVSIVNYETKLEITTTAPPLFKIRPRILFIQRRLLSGGCLHPTPLAIALYTLCCLQVSSLPLQ